MLERCPNPSCNSEKVIPQVQMQPEASEIMATIICADCFTSSPIVKKKIFDPSKDKKKFTKMIEQLIHIWNVNIPRYDTTGSS